jgi:hypothetical protein
MQSFDSRTCGTSGGSQQEKYTTTVTNPLSIEKKAASEQPSIYQVVNAQAFASRRLLFFCGGLSFRFRRMA